MKNALSERTRKFFLSLIQSSIPSAAQERAISFTPIS
jgi:hypothetical protein